MDADVLSEQPTITLGQLAIGQTVEKRVDNLEKQVDHHTALLQSERGSRARAHKHLHERLDKQDKILVNIQRLIWMIIGGGIALKALPWLTALMQQHRP